MILAKKKRLFCVVMDLNFIKLKKKLLTNDGKVA